jgi:hypothetical protein
MFSNFSIIFIFIPHIGHSLFYIRISTETKSKPNAKSSAKCSKSQVMTSLSFARFLGRTWTPSLYGLDLHTFNKYRVIPNFNGSGKYIFI